MKYVAAKARLCRRFGTNIFGSEKYAKILKKRSTKPGQHTKSFSKKSDYGKQLEEKQKARFVYGVTEKQLSRYYEQASKSKENTGIAFMTQLERRLDNVVFQSGLAVTRMQARQMVGHGLFALNGKKVITPSIQVKVGDEITIREKYKNSPLLEKVREVQADTPKWVQSDRKKFSAKVVALPDENDFGTFIEVQKIIEFYSR